MLLLGSLPSLLGGKEVCAWPLELCDLDASAGFFLRCDRASGVSSTSFETAVSTPGITWTLMGQTG